MSIDLPRLTQLAHAGDLDALRVVARHHLRSNSLRGFIEAMPAPSRDLARFEPVASLKGRLWCEDVHRRFFLVRQSTWSFTLHDRERGFEAVGGFKNLIPQSLHPEGRLIAAQWASVNHHHVAVRDQEGAQRSITLPRPPGWDGTPIAEGEEPTSHGYASTAVSFSADGERLFVAGFGEDHKACVHVLKSDTLERVSTLDHPEEYNREWPPKRVRQGTWMELWRWAPDPHSPEHFIYASSCGDSFGAAHFWRFEEGALREADDLEFDRLATSSFSYYLQHVGFRRGGDALVVIDRDNLVSLVEWPSMRLILESVNPARPWYNEDRQLEPWPEKKSRDAYLLIGDTFVAQVGDWLIFPIVDSDDYETHALLVTDAETLVPLGMLRPPRHRFSTLEMTHHGDGLFAARGKTQTRFWQLVSEDAGGA